MPLQPPCCPSSSPFVSTPPRYEPFGTFEQPIPFPYNPSPPHPTPKCSMFAAVCSGRPMQLAQQLEPTKWGISIPNASNINYITVFMLPNSEFTDPNYTALVYFQIKNQEFKLLGGLNPNKPLAIYRLNTALVVDDDMMGDEVNIGISIEPTPQAEQQLMLLTKAPAAPAAPAAPKNVDEVATLANKIVGHAYTYLGSFIDNQGKVPMKAFDSWWDKFKQKLQNNPRFLDLVNND